MPTAGTSTGAGGRPGRPVSCWLRSGRQEHSSRSRCGQRPRPRARRASLCLTQALDLDRAQHVLVQCGHCAPLPSAVVGPSGAVGLMGEQWPRGLAGHLQPAWSALTESAQCPDAPPHHDRRPDRHAAVSGPDQLLRRRAGARPGGAVAGRRTRLREARTGSRHRRDAEGRAATADRGDGRHGRRCTPRCGWPGCGPARTTSTPPPYSPRGGPCPAPMRSGGTRPARRWCWPRTDGRSGGRPRWWHPTSPLPNAWC